MKHINIKLFGKVQDTGFRWATLKLARALDLRGFIRNEEDGSVLIELEGEATELDKFIEWARKGPQLALVDKIQIAEGESKGYNTFEIKH